MNKKTQLRMANIKKQARMITYNERGMAAKIEEALKLSGCVECVAAQFGVSLEYVTTVKQAMERRK